jgi:ABC-type phosphate transport system auxiliary subunit
MSEVHLVVGVSLIGLNLLAASWGGVAWLRDRASIAFWYMLRAAQVSVFIQVTLGALLVVTGHEAADGLHYVYGVLPLPISLLAEAARTGAAEREIGELEFETLPGDQQRTIALAIVRREMGIMTVSCLVIFLLALRAAGTSTAF